MTHPSISAYLSRASDRPTVIVDETSTWVLGAVHLLGQQQARGCVHVGAAQVLGQPIPAFVHLMLREDFGRLACERCFTEPQVRVCTTCFADAREADVRLVIGHVDLLVLIGALCAACREEHL